MSTFLDLLDGVSAYYGSGSDEWVRIATGGVTPQTIPIIQQVPGVTITRSASGSILGYDYANPFPATPSGASIIDSNIQTGSYGLTSYTANVPASSVTDPGTGLTTLQSGAVQTGTGQLVKTVADRVSLAFAGVALGTKLGLAVDSALYSANPAWWDEHFPTMNPSTWETLVPEGVAGNVVRSLIGIGQDDATMYLDERIFAYAYQAMLKSGAFEPSSGQATVDYHGSTEGLNMNNITLPLQLSGFGLARAGTSDLWAMTAYNDRSMCFKWLNTYQGGSWSLNVISVSEMNDVKVLVQSASQGQYYVADPLTIQGHTFYYAWGARAMSTTNFREDFPFYTICEPTVTAPDAATIAFLLMYGEYSEGEDTGIIENAEAGIHPDPDTIINPTTGLPVTPEDDLDDVLQALKDAYPDLFDDSIYEDLPQDDGTVARVTYIPVPYPNIDPYGNPVSDLTPDVDPQADPQIDQESRPDASQGLTDSVTTPPDPPATGSGDTPPAVVPTGSASALYSIYNPSAAELSSFGAWLWSTNFVDQLLKLFSDPMQAIIGLHKVFCTPPVSGRGNIKVGYLDSGVATNLVSGQYVSIPCGSVSLYEYFGNVMDYDPYTRVQIYLPFVGIQPLDTGDVMRGTLTVAYHIDVLTGACLAEVSVTRDGAGGILYTYAGNAAVQYPVSSGSYMGILSTVVSMAGGIAGTIASGGALAPLAMGAASGILSARTRVQHSGGFSGNAGAMGARIPYLIVTRPQSALALNFQDYEGYPANHTTTIGSCSGFIRCKVAHLEGIPATSGELSELEGLLEEGIII